MIKRSPLRPSSLPIARKAYLKRGKRPRTANPKRKAREFERAYHSEERVLFVKGLPCCACKVVGHSENAHIETGGIGRKADYTKIVPLCGMRVWKTPLSENWYIGCHRRYDELRQNFTERWQLDMDAEARRTGLAWLAHTEEGK